MRYNPNIALRKLVIKITAMREYRKKLGLTQTELAKALKVTNATIAMWEAGTRKPNIIMLKKLAKILHCTADELLEPIEI